MDFKVIQVSDNAITQNLPCIPNISQYEMCIRDSVYTKNERGDLKMDIGAYARIEDLSAILASTGINIPRLRGLRLMATEEKISEDEILSLIHI